MSDILSKTIVLVLNRNWQAINIRTPQDAFCQMATNVATAIDIEGDEHIRPVKWDEWITLPVRPQDNAVCTARGAIRVSIGPSTAEAEIDRFLKVWQTLAKSLSRGMKQGIAA